MRGQYYDQQQQRRPGQYERVAGALGPIENMLQQGDESDLMRQRIMQMQQQSQQFPLEQQINEEKLKAMMFQNSPEQQGLQTQLMQGQTQRYDQLPDILQAGGYLQDPALLDYILKQKGYLGADFNRHPANPQDEALKQQIQQHLQSKGAR